MQYANEMHMSKDDNTWFLYIKLGRRNNIDNYITTDTICTSQTLQNISGPIASEATSKIPYTSRGSAFDLDCVHIPVKKKILW